MKAVTALLCASVGLAPAAAQAGGWFPVPGAAGAGASTLYNLRVKTMQDLRFENVVRQQYDLSCGAAALATLLSYFYGDTRSEREIIDEILEFGDAEKIGQSGFSMLELKRYAERLGYVAQGYLVEDASKLERVKIPYLTLIDVRGYMHFVVVKRVSAGRVFIADPAFGNRTTDLETFERGWTQKILGVMSATNAGIADFAEHAALEGRPQDVPLLTDYGLRPIPPTPGSFR